MKLFRLFFFIVLTMSIGMFSRSLSPGQIVVHTTPKPSHSGPNYYYYTPSVQHSEDSLEVNLPISPQKKPSPPGWTLVWGDEFNNQAIDESKWNMEEFASTSNNELQYYTPNNIILSNGTLKLISEKESYRGRNYTSGAIQSRDKFSFLYGKVEMRAKLPAGKGIFPAFWMLTDKKDTWLPEIDILEMLGDKPNEIWMVLHSLDKANKMQRAFTSFTGEDFSKSFHLFSLEWTPDSLTWFIDGKERFKVRSSIPQENMYLYLNTAIGGDWPGSPDSSTFFPAVYEVDYVRVFKKFQR